MAHLKQVVTFTVAEVLEVFKVFEELVTFRVVKVKLVSALLILKVQCSSILHPSLHPRSFMVLVVDFLVVKTGFREKN